MKCSELITQLRREAELPRTVGQSMAIVSPALLDEAAESLELLFNAFGAATEILREVRHDGE